MKKLLFAFVIILGISFTSCYKEPENGIAKIRVNNSSVYGQPSANVTLTGPPGSNINVSGLTDMNGDWVYEHEPALEVILTISASYGASTGSGIIRIKPNETSSKIVTLSP